MQRIDIGKISRDVAAGKVEYRRPPTVVRVPLWLVVVALLAVVAMAIHAV